MDNSYFSSFWKIKTFFKTIANNIAFIPGVLGVAGFLLGVLAGLSEKWGITPYLIEKAPFLIINNYETAATLLSYLSAGIISIMVFSFSMVMLLLNQASSNFSPRVLPGLISVRKHQYILGLYLGTLLYNTFVMVGIEPTKDQYQLPGFSILIGIILTIICLFFFIYFIDSISKSIQVESILDSIFNKASKRLQFIIDNQKDAVSFPDSENWTSYSAKTFGYFRGLNREGLLDICEKENFKLELLQYQGFFVGEGMPLFKSSKPLSDDELNSVFDFILLNRSTENVSENDVLGFKQIAEIGVRAMSPGVNDPGTAVNTIDYLTELFALKLLEADCDFICKEEGNPCVKLRTLSFSDLLSQIMMSYRTYCKQDMTCNQKLVVMMATLVANPNATKIHKDAIKEELDKLMYDVAGHIKNAQDLDLLKQLANKVSFD